MFIRTKNEVINGYEKKNKKNNVAMLNSSRNWWSFASEHCRMESKWCRFKNFVTRFTSTFYMLRNKTNSKNSAKKTNFLWTWAQLQLNWMPNKCPQQCGLPKWINLEYKFNANFDNTFQNLKWSKAEAKHLTKNEKIRSVWLRWNSPFFTKWMEQQTLFAYTIWEATDVHSHSF